MIMSDKCPYCGADEIPFNGPATQYACGSNSYDGRPGTFTQSERCWERSCKDTVGTDPVSPLSQQVGGSHYKDLKIQPVVYCHQNKLGGIESAVVKYVTRHKFKNGKEDIEKAIHLLNILIELEYKQ